MEDSCKSGEASGDSLVINEDMEEEDEEDRGGSEEEKKEEDGGGGRGSSSEENSEEEEAKENPEESPASGPLGKPKVTTLNVPSVTVSSVNATHSPLPFPSSAASSHPPGGTPPSTPSIPPLPPGTIAKPVVDERLEKALDGNEPTVRNLIMAAIGVMKNRKARPDGKRISNWINRRYGRPVISINEELDKMVVAGELTRVDYKGSASYRITTAEAKSARRRRRMQKSANQNIPTPPTLAPSTLREGSLTVEPILRQPNLSSQKTALPQPQQQPSPSTLPKIPQQPSAFQPPIQSPQAYMHHHPPPMATTPGPIQHKYISPHEISLRTVVLDYMADLSASGIPLHDELSIKFIGRAVDASRRNINRGAVLANLESLLEKEVQAGHFIKAGEDIYVIQPSWSGGYHPIPSTPPQPFMLTTPVSMTNTVINPAPMPPPPSAGPPPFLSTSSAPPPPQILNIGTSGGPNLSEYMFNNASPATAIPLTVTPTSRPPTVLNSTPINGRIFPPPPPPSSSSSLASATPPLPNFTKMTFISSGTPKPPMSTASSSVSVSLSSGSQQYHSQPQSVITAPNGDSKSDEERKNDLIQEKLSKMSKGFEKSPYKKSSGGKNEPLPLYVVMREKRLSNRGGKVNLMLEYLAQTSKDTNGSNPVNPSASNGSDSSAATTMTSTSTTVTPTTTTVPAPRKVGRPKKGSKPPPPPPPPPVRVSDSKRKRKDHHEEVEEDEDEDEEEDDDDDDERQEEWKNRSSSKISSSNGVGGNTRSSRKKKSRKIFDPADHETPTRKRKAVNSPTPSFDEEFSKDGNCLYCDGSALRNKKGRAEPLLKCKDCSTIVHPSCLDYSEELSKKILQSPWQCINCKVCSICESNKDDVYMAFCDGCDLGFHADCHTPKIIGRPAGRWECFRCMKTSVKAVAKNAPEQINGHGLNNGLATIKRSDSTDSNLVNRFMPVLPPHMHPHTGSLPDNWEDYPPDPEIPDVSYWSPKQVRDYFVRNGFLQEQARAFFEQEIDGQSLLLLQRSDVTMSLGLKLGPALKIFNLIKKLQTRRHFPG